MIVTPESRKQELQSNIQQLAKESADALTLQRLFCILLVHAGSSPAQVASRSGLNERSIRRWVQRYDKQGLQGIKEMVPSGRPARLEKEQIVKLFRQIRKPPSYFGYLSERWTGKLLQHHIQHQEQVTLSLRQCQRLLKDSRAQVGDDGVVSGGQE
jgi:transposase